MGKLFLSIFVLLKISLFALTQDLTCKDLNNGQITNNPIYTKPECAFQCSICQECESDAHSLDCPPRACLKAGDENNSMCLVDGYVGSYVIMEDEFVRVWNFTLEPGQMTSMHKHDFDYSFVAVKPSRLEVFGEDGKRLFDFWATKLSLRVNGDYLEPTGDIKLPWKIPRVHAARNIGTETYNEILYENKYSTEKAPIPLETRLEL